MIKKTQPLAFEAIGGAIPKSTFILLEPTALFFCLIFLVGDNAEKSPVSGGKLGQQCAGYTLYTGGFPSCAHVYVRIIICVAHVITVVTKHKTVETGGLCN